MVLAEDHQAKADVKVSDLLVLQVPRVALGIVNFVSDIKKLSCMKE